MFAIREYFISEWVFEKLCFHIPFIKSINTRYGLLTSRILTPTTGVPLILLVYNKHIKACRRFTRSIPAQPQTPIHHRPKTSHGTFRSIPIFRTCTFRGITPSLLKSFTRKARNEFQLPALANIRSTSPTRDATDSKSRRFLETSANPTHVPRGCGTL